LFSFLPNIPCECHQILTVIPDSMEAGFFQIVCGLDYQACGNQNELVF